MTAALTLLLLAMQGGEHKITPRYVDKLGNLHVDCRATNISCEHLPVTDRACLPPLPPCTQQQRDDDWFKEHPQADIAPKVKPKRTHHPIDVPAVEYKGSPIKDENDNWWHTPKTKCADPKRVLLWSDDKTASHCIDFTRIH
jgi:hypothetical protein